MGNYRIKFLLTGFICCAMLVAQSKEARSQSSCQYNFTQATTLAQGVVASVPLSGASMILIKDGQTVYERYFGSFSDNRTVLIASSSKWLAGATLMALVDEGALSLDDPVSKYLQYFTGQKGTMTLRQMFSHTSGLPTDSALTDTGTGTDVPCLNDRATTLDGCARAIAQLDLIGPPGGQFSYGGTSMQVAGRVCEVVSGKSWEALFQEKIAGPLAMTGTTYGISRNPLVAGGVLSRLRDYANFLQMIQNEGVFNGKRILSREAVREMQKDQTFGVPIVYSPHTQYGNGEFRYGIGEWIDLKDAQGGSVQVSSQGAFGFSPWVDRQRNLLGIFMVQNSLQKVYETVSQIQQKVGEAIDACNVSLLVNRGSRSGTIQAGATIHLFADPSPPGQVFERWVGDTGVLADPTASHTTLVMPNRNIGLTATYKPAPAWNPIVEIINGVNVGYYVPPNPAGIVFRFHGSGGNFSSFFEKVEDRITANALVAAGYAVVSVDSFDRINRQWDNRNLPASNRDLQNVSAIIDSFIQRKLIRTTTPVFSLGISNGGAFSSWASFFLNFNGGAIYIASGRDPIYFNSAAVPYPSVVPTIWCRAQNDSVSDQADAVRAQDNFNELKRRGIPAKFLVNPAAPLYPDRFLRIAGLGVDDSNSIYQGIKNGGYLDGQDYLKANPGTSGVAGAIPAKYSNYSKEIIDQLIISYSEHQYFSDFDSQLIGFFDGIRHRGMASAGAASYRTESLAVESIVAGFGSGLAPGTFNAQGFPLPDTLGGTSVRIRDIAGTERAAPLFFASSNQINYQIPPLTVSGFALVAVNNQNVQQAGQQALGRVLITAIAPAIFTADSSGQGIAAASILRIKASGEQVSEPVVRYDSAQNRFVGIPVDLGPQTDRVILTLYGTGIRFRTSSSNVRASVAGIDAEVLYAGVQNDFVGLDQINLVLPRTLAGKGECEVKITIDGMDANPVRLIVK